jgi:hypothetical protein
MAIDAGVLSRTASSLVDTPLVDRLLTVETHVLQYVVL